jgi:hypothetical protein
MDNQMRAFADGGLKQEGGMVDEESGNDVPLGSTRAEVRDDIDAKLSEGEFVFPADVVRYFGLEKLMKLREQAKNGLQKMNDMGQMGNSDEATLPDDIPFTEDDLIMEEDEDDQMEMAFKEGGLVKKTTPKIDFRSLMGDSFLTFVEYRNAAGAKFNIPFFGGKPAFAIPNGYTRYDGEDAIGNNDTPADKLVTGLRMDHEKNEKEITEKPFDMANASNKDLVNEIAKADSVGYKAMKGLATLVGGIAVSAMVNLNEAQLQAEVNRRIKAGILTEEEVKPIKDILPELGWKDPTVTLDPTKIASNVAARVEQKIATVEKRITRIVGKAFGFPDAETKKAVEDTVNADPSKIQTANDGTVNYGDTKSALDRTSPTVDTTDDLRSARTNAPTKTKSESTVDKTDDQRSARTNAPAKTKPEPTVDTTDDLRSARTNAPSAKVESTLNKTGVLSDEYEAPKPTGEYPAYTGVSPESYRNNLSTTTTFGGFTPAGDLTSATRAPAATATTTEATTETSTTPDATKGAPKGIGAKKKEEETKGVFETIVGKKFSETKLGGFLGLGSKPLTTSVKDKDYERGYTGSGVGGVARGRISDGSSRGVVANADGTVAKNSRGQTVFRDSTGNTYVKDTFGNKTSVNGGAYDGPGDAQEASGGMFGGYKDLKDMFDGGGPGRSAADDKDKAKFARGGFVTKNKHKPTPTKRRGIAARKK